MFEPNPKTCPIAMRYVFAKTNSNDEFYGKFFGWWRVKFWVYMSMMTWRVTKMTRVHFHSRVHSVWYEFSTWLLYAAVHNNLWSFCGVSVDLLPFLWLFVWHARFRTLNSKPKRYDSFDHLICRHKCFSFKVCSQSQICIKML